MNVLRLPYTVNKLSGLKSRNVCIVSQLWRLQVQNQPPLPPHSHSHHPVSEGAKGGSVPASPAATGLFGLWQHNSPLHSLLPGHTCLCPNFPFFWGHQPCRVRAHLTLTNYLGNTPASFSGPGSQSFNIEIGGGGGSIQPKSHATSYWSLWSKGESDLALFKIVIVCSSEILHWFFLIWH